jgi:hypothetical protein
MAIKILSLVIFLITQVESTEESEIRALLLAGSNGFMNYRHQADLCHQYHLLTSVLDVDPNRVTVMMYDDVAWSNNNPLLGKLYNRPNGTNVYKGCEVDYRKSEVNGDTFVDILSKIGSPNSTVFLSFVDHGQPGSLLLPNGELLDADTLISGLYSLKSNKTIVYVEACYAGSLFENKTLPENTIVITASNATESSWAAYCPTDKHPFADSVNGVHIGTCLGDLFSISWVNDIEKRVWEMENSDTPIPRHLIELSDQINPPLPPTLNDHINTVRDRVATKSTVMVYGNKSLLNLLLFDIFPARTTKPVPSIWERLFRPFGELKRASLSPNFDDSELLESSQPVTSFNDTRLTIPEYFILL